MDPFIIVKNYRQQRQAFLDETTPLPPVRIFLRELDTNTLVSRQVQSKTLRVYCEEDKENFNYLMDLEGEEAMKKLPTPNQSNLINYSDYDLLY